LLSGSKVLIFPLCIVFEKGRGSMLKRSSEKESESRLVGKVCRWFDGIRFLWQTSETRYLLKLILILLGLMLFSFSLLIGLITLFGRTILLYGSFFLLYTIFIGWFLFILLELVRFYRNDRKYRLFPERNPLLQMKYWHESKAKMYEGRFRRFSYAMLIVFIVLWGGFLLSEVLFLFLGFMEAGWLWVVYNICLGLLTFYTTYFNVLMWFYFGLLAVFLFIIMGIWFFLGFISVKGTMNASAERFTEKFQRKRYWFFVLLPIPWVFLIGILFWKKELYVVSYLLGGEYGSLWVIPTLYLYVFICVLGFVAFFNRGCQARYTASQLAASYTLLSVIFIPLFTGLFFSLLGTVVSLLAVGYNFIRDTLDGCGDELREYYGDWEKKLQRFGITSEDIVSKRNYDRTFETTPLETDVPNAYRNLILNLSLLLLAFFGILSLLAPLFLSLGAGIGTESIEIMLNVNSFTEIMGITLALFIYVLVIGFRKQKLSL